MKQGKRMAAIEIENVIKPTIFNFFTEKELAVAKNIDVNVVLDERISRVQAIDYTGKKKIEISTGFISLIAALAEAEHLAIKFKKEAYMEKYFWEIEKYLNSYQDNALKGVKKKWPDSFYLYAGISKDAYQKELNTQEYNNAFSLLMRTSLSYILTHEYAHHIFGHMGKKKPKDLAESRRNEDEADDFSIRVNWAIGNSPLSIMNYFILFSMIENNLYQGTHAPSACRLEKFLHAGIKFEEGSLKYYEPTTRKMLEKGLNKVKEKHPPLRKACEEGSALTNSTIPIL